MILARLTIALAAAIALALVPQAPAQNTETLVQAIRTNIEAGRFLEAARDTERLADQLPGNPHLHNRAGELYFFAARPQESVLQFDRALALTPDEEPHHWQRGISHYYAGMFEEGVRQFELHRTVNGNDVENSAFHFICLAKAEGLAAARARLIPVTGDKRVPMDEIMRMFAGDLETSEVIVAAGTNPNHLCYAHLYVGLYLEAIGEDDAALEHVGKAATDYRQEHYMGQVAKVHLKLRTAPSDPGP